LVLAAAAGSIITGNFSELVVMFVGFISATLFFLGIVGILPLVMNKRFAPK
jgi:hypothetical protein